MCLFCTYKRILKVNELKVVVIKNNIRLESFVELAMSLKDYKVENLNLYMLLSNYVAMCSSKSFSDEFPDHLTSF